MIALGAVVSGFLLAQIALALGAFFLKAETGLFLTPHLDIALLAEIAMGAIGIALVASLVPAVRAATTQIEKVLQS